MSVANLQARKRLKKFLKATSGRGWDVRAIDPEWNPENPTYLYVVDAKTGYMQTYGLSHEEFQRAVSAGAAAPAHKAEAIRSALSSAVADLAEGRLMPVDRTAAIHLIGTCAAEYAGMTQTYATQENWINGHFFVLVYRFPDHILRPFGLKSADGQMLEAEVALQRCGQIIAMDRQNHPDWFGPSADILPFPKQ